MRQELDTCPTEAESFHKLTDEGMNVTHISTLNLFSDFTKMCVCHHRYLEERVV